MVERHELVAYLRELMCTDAISDYCPNGLQVEGRPRIKRILAGVTACEALLEEAEKWDACAVLVHHGPSRPHTKHASSVSVFWRPVTMRPSGLVCRRWASTWPNNLHSNTGFLTFRTRPSLCHATWCSDRLSDRLHGADCSADVINSSVYRFA